jgi:hypothetical protein
MIPFQGRAGIKGGAYFFVPPLQGETPAGGKETGNLIEVIMSTNQMFSKR